MGQFGVMIGQLVGFLIMLMVGYGCVRLRFYGQTALDGMCSLLLNVLILCSCSRTRRRRGPRAARRQLGRDGC